jgi:hypothetical protein
MLLNGQHKGVLIEWLETAGATEQRAHEDNLPLLLEAGRKTRELRPGISRVLGKRGRWLAAQNPAWEYAIPSGDDDTVWETGNHESRRLFLNRIRADDPERSRELLASTWSAESAKGRADLLAVLRMGLSPDEEPFLERTLDDRSQRVRKVAADLLARLPGSELCQRMFERTRPLLTWEAGGPRRFLSRGRRPELRVTLPPEYTAEMERDGVIQKASGNRGPKAWWLVQMLGAVPLRNWTRLFDTTPAELIDAADRGEWRSTLLEGWAIANERHQEPEWGEALIRSWMGKPLSISVTDLMQTLTPSHRESLTLEILKKAPSVNSDQPGHWAVHSCAHAWSAELSRALLRVIKRQLAKREIKHSWKWSETLGWCARRMDVTVLSQAHTTLDPHAKDKQVEHFLVTLDFRHEMLNVLRHRECSLTWKEVR